MPNRQGLQHFLQGGPRGGLPWKAFNTTGDIANPEWGMVWSEGQAVGEGYAPACVNFDVTNKKVYINEGTATTAVWADNDTSMDINELTAGIVAVGADSIAFLDATDSLTYKESIADLMTAAAGVGLSATAGVLALDLNELVAEVMASGDFIPFVDTTDNGTHKETIDDIATLFAGLGLSASSAVLALDLNELTAEVMAAGDFIPFVDTTDGGTHKETIDDIATLLAGVGLSATSAVLALDLSELTGAVLASTDSIPFLDATDASTKIETIDDIVTLMAGVGLSATNAVLALDLSELTGAAIASTDSIAFLDATDASTKIETIDDIATLLAGLGLAASSAVLALDLNELTAEVMAAGDFIPFVDTTDGGTHKETIDDIATLLAGVGLAATSAVLALDLSGLTGAVLAATDSIPFLDATDASTKIETIDDIATLMAGEGLSATNAVLALDINEVTGAAIADGDSIIFLDATDSSTKLEALNDVATLFAGNGLTSASSQLQIDLNEIGAAVIDVAADSIAFIDATDAGTKQESVADFVSGIAGTDLSAAAGVLSIPGTASVQRWKTIATGSFTATPTDTDTLAMSATAGMVAGLPVEYTIAAVALYGIVAAVVTDTSIDILGPSLSGDVTLLRVGTPEMIRIERIKVDGTYANGADANLLAVDELNPIAWESTKAYLAHFTAAQETVDTGTEPKVNVQINNAQVSTMDSSNGIQLGAAATIVANAAASINTANYDINYGEELEIECTVAGGSTDATNLHMVLYFVMA